jgi:soluble lytic murein transglycosylase
MTFRAVLCVVAALLTLAPPARAVEAPAEGAEAMAEAMNYIAARDWPAADRLARQAGRNADIARDIVAWHRLRAGDGAFADYSAFLARRPDWPGLPWLRARGESAIKRGAPPAAIIAYFGDGPPRTSAGGLALIGALRAQGKTGAARAEALRLWREMTLSAEEEQALLSRYAETLAPHHTERLDRLLWQGETGAAERMAPLVPEGWRRLAVARIALRLERPGVDALINAVPEALAEDPGLAWERARWRLANGMADRAADLMIARSISAKSLGRPARWADARARLARDVLWNGDYRRAYRLAAGHFLDSGADAAEFSELEWLAGFVALRKLNEPDRALRHFQAMRMAVSTPISLSRAAYWEGRAHEAAGRAEAARAAYTYGAEFQSAYYGLLAADRAGLPLDPTLTARARPLPDWRKAGFANSSVLRASLLLLAAGERDLARRFFLHLAEGRGGADYDALAALAHLLDAPDFAVLLAKQATFAGLILPDAYFPNPDILPEGLAVPRALALSIARRESEFNSGVISPAGARGLMQLMPGTAELMAREMNLPYSRDRLTSDPAYNAQLGAGYLARLIAEFGDAPVLVAAGYNAGPGRPRDWVRTLGDPRLPGVDVVDWVEHVPFAETRNYIMRVLESLVIYRARLDGPQAAPRLTQLLKGG